MPYMFTPKKNSPNNNPTVRAIKSSIDNRTLFGNRITGTIKHANNWNKLK
jgi:hypothetical protein